MTYKHTTRMPPPFSYYLKKEKNSKQHNGITKSAGMQVEGGEDRGVRQRWIGRVVEGRDWWSGLSLYCLHIFLVEGERRKEVNTRENEMQKSVHAREVMQ